MSDDKVMSPLKCADVDGSKIDYNEPHFKHINEAEPGDIIWTFGKTGRENLGHVVTKIANCETDTRYCYDNGWNHTHEPVPMCECGWLWMHDHHWGVRRYFSSKSKQRLLKVLNAA